MELYLLRHAIAIDRGAPGYEDDRLRPLTSEGRKKMERVAKGMHALKLSFNIIFSSPYVRARETAEIVAARFKLKKKLKPIEALEADADPEDLIDLLRSLLDSPERVLMIGHEPYLGELAGLLIAGDPPADVKFKKAGLCKLSLTKKLVHGRCAELHWLLTPGQLADLA